MSSGLINFVSISRFYFLDFSFVSVMISEDFTRFLFGRSLTVGLSKRPPGRFILLSLTQRGNKVEIVATISTLYLILLSVAIEVFLSANVLHLANFIPPNAVFRVSLLQGEPNTKLADMQYRASLGFFLRLFSCS